MLTWVAGALSLTLPGLAVPVLAVAIVAVIVVACTARSVWPIVLVLALLLVAASLTAALTRWNGEVGQLTRRPQAVAEIQPSYEVAAGSSCSTSPP